MNKCPSAEAYGTCQLESCRECHGMDGRIAHIAALEFAQSRQPGTAVLGSNGLVETGETKRR